MHRLYEKLLIVVIMSSLMTGALSVYAQMDYEPYVEMDACPINLPAGEIEGQTVDCGYLIVPQDRHNLAEGNIELAFAILHSTSNNPVPDPVLYLEGGPGGSALSGADAWYNDPSRAKRDIILLDQRGTGYSIPRLYCYEFEEIDDDSKADAALRECRDRLTADGVDVGDYTSANNAADVNDLRIALGIDEWNLLGVSYGTRLALTVMRDYPQGVRSVILDSSYPPVVDAYEEQPVNTYRVFSQMFGDCAADAACNGAYPNLEARFFDLIERMNNDPADIAEIGEFFGDDLTLTMFDFFYDTSLVPYMPLMIDEFDRGVYETFIAIDSGELPPMEDDGSVPFDENDTVLLFADEVYWLTEDMDDDTYYAFWDEIDAMEYWDFMPDILREYFAADDAEYLVELYEGMNDDDLVRLEAELYYEDVSDSDGMFNSVECNEELPFNSYAEAEGLAASLPAVLRESELIGVQEMFNTCVTWNSGVADAIEDEAVVSSIPTLVLAGSYDPITPPSWGKIAASTLENGFFYEFPGVGHGAIDGGDCPVSIIQAFLDNPNSAPDGGCIGGMSVEFVLP
jgi:pimeloyl-ACP methyl ester carboxylesterase